MNRLPQKINFTPLESTAIYGGDEIYKSLIPYRKGGVKAPSFLTGFIRHITVMIVTFGLYLIFAFPVYAKINWINIGPGGGGWIECLAVDPTNSDIVYAGSDVGGILKSYDGGKTWQVLNKGLKNDFVRDIAIDSQNPNIIYAATAAGVHKSIDGGRSWVIKRNGFPLISNEDFSAPVNALAIDPNNSSILYAGIGKRDSYGRGKIYKSIDGGENWILIDMQKEINPKAVIYSICIHPTKPKIIFIGTNYGVYKSNNGGNTWIPKNKGLAHINVRKIAISKTYPFKLFLTLSSPTQTKTWQGGVYCSSDEGESWYAVNQRLPQNMGSCDSTTSNFYPIEVDPYDSKICYVGDVSWVTAGLYKTTNAGKSWTKCTYLKNLRDYGWLTQWGLSINCMALAPNKPQVIYIGTSGHIFKSKDGGNSWEQVYTTKNENGFYTTRGLETTCIHSLTLDSKNPNTFYIGYFDIGLMKTTDGGKSFQRIVKGMDYDNSTFNLVIDPDNPSVLYAGIGEWSENKGSFCKSQDSGETWKVLGKYFSLPDGRVRFISVDPQSPMESRDIYIGIDGQGVFKSEDGGKKWACLNAGLNLQDIRALLLRPINPKVLYVAIGSNSKESGGIYMSKDDGRTWDKVNANIEFPNIQIMIFDPKDSNILYLGSREYYDSSNNKYFSGGLFKSIDGGKTWVKLLEDKFVSAITFNPYNSNTIYVALPDHNYHDYSRGRGVYRSRDNGKTWESLNEGLGSLRINALAISFTKPPIIYCSSEGNGLFMAVEDSREKL